MQIIGHPTKRAWLTIGLLWISACSYNVAQLMIVTMHTSIVATIPMTEANFGLMTSIFPWVFGVLSFFAGFLSDRHSRSRVIMISIFSWATITCLMAFVTTYPQLLAMRALLAVSQACYLPAAGAMIADYHPGPTRSLAAGIHLTGFYLGAVLGGVGGWLAERHTWHFAFAAVGIASIAYGLILMFVLRDAPKDRVGEPVRVVESDPVHILPAIRSLFTQRSFIVVLICVTLADALGWAMSGWMPTFLGERFHLGQGAAGLYGAGCLNATTVVGLVVGGAWSDRWSNTNQRSRFFVAAIGLSIAAPFILLTVNTSVLALAIAGLLLAGLTASWFTANLLPMLCLTTEPRYRATGYGLVNSVVFMVGGVVIYGTGVLRDLHISLSTIFNAGVIGWVLCAVLLLYAKPETVVLETK